MVNDENQVIVYYAGNFNNISKQYGTVATLQFNSDSQAKAYKSKQDSLMTTSAQQDPIVFRSKKSTLHDVFFGESEYGDEKEVFDLYIGLPSHGSKPFMTANMKVVDVPQYEHFDDDEYPEFLSYFLYGDKKDAFLFHIPTKNPDFLQVTVFMKNNKKSFQFHLLNSILTQFLDDTDGRYSGKVRRRVESRLHLTIWTRGLFYQSPEDEILPANWLTQYKV